MYANRKIESLIHCEISGREDAPVLVFLHGNGEDLHVFDSQVRYFSDCYRTVAVDTRGHGLSTRGGAPLNFHTFATDLLALFDALRIDKAHVVGFSDGAATALHTALLAPERLSSMVLIGTNCNPGGLRLIPRLQILLMYAWLSAAALFSDKKGKRKEIWGLMVHQPKLTIAEISRITVPTLVVTGQNDMVSQRHNDEINRAIAGSERLIIPNGDHFWFFSQPEMLNKCLMGFLKKQN